MEISKMLTISTAHIKPESSTFLDEEYTFCKTGLVVYHKAGYGWFIYISVDYMDYKAPEDIKDCMRIAECNGCSWLCLDCDGEIINELPVYDWN